MISYYLKDNLFGKNEINYLTDLTDEKYWFQNYHLILYCPELLSHLEDSIEKYLIPKRTTLPYCNKESKSIKRTSYLDFYKTNLTNKKSIIRDIPSVKQTIIEYLGLRMQESEEIFDDSDE